MSAGAAEIVSESEVYARLYAKCAVDRVFFVEEVLGASPEPWQRDVLGALDRGETRISIRSGNGVGKALSLDTLVPTPDRGWMRWGDIQEGDFLFGANGAPTEVLARYDWSDRQVYRVWFDDGSYVDCDGAHLWRVQGWDKKRKARGDWQTLSLEQIMETGIRRKVGDSRPRQWCVPVADPAQYPEMALPIDPYVLGAWLGDGKSAGGSICKPCPDLWAEIERRGYTISDDHARNSDRAETRTIYGLQAVLRAEGLLNAKHIPDDYLIASVDQRLDLLRGLLDTDGWVEANGTVAFLNKNVALVEGVIELARSLGMKARRVQDKFVPGYGAYARCSITANRLDLFYVREKAARMRLPSQERYHHRWIDRVELLGEQDVMCVTVDAPDSLYLCGQYVVTHNTALCAWLAVHFILFRQDVKIPVTAPSSSQLKDGLIPETKRWIRELPEYFQNQLEMTEDRIRRTEDGANNFISFRTARADAPEALAGIHASHVLCIVDEASGVPDIVFEMAAGTLSSAGSIMVLIGNPTRPKGYFHRTHTSLSDFWFTKKVASFDSSRVTQDFVDGIGREYGLDSNVYRYKVLGEFPASTADTVIPQELIDSALDRDVDVLPKAERIWGVDPGRGGDPTGFCVRAENVVEALEEWSDADLMRVVGRVKQRWDETEPNLRPTTIYVDSIGLGAGVADRLRELDLPCVDVNVAESPSMKDRYVRLRSELWYAVRAWLEQRNVGMRKEVPLMAKLAAELGEPQAMFTSSGKADVESKAVMKQRGVASPNLADSLCLTFAGGGAIAVGRAQGKRTAWAKPLGYSAPHIV